jgi:DNA modification methylase
MSLAKILVGDCRARLEEIENGAVQTCITSPPYFGLRDYGNDAQIGMEMSPKEYLKELVSVFGEVWRVLADDGTLWLNLGDSYAGSGRGPAGTNSIQGTNQGSLTGNIRNRSGVDWGSRNKELMGVPWRMAFALQDEGWYLRQDIIWAKPNPIPESVTDRCTKSHEYLFLLTKSDRYYCNMDAISEEATTGWNGSRFDTGKTADHQLQRASKQPRFCGTKYGDSDDPLHATKSGNEYEPNGRRNKRDVWTVGTEPYAGAHFAVMPTELVKPCILAGSREGDTVLDPFAGSGTVGVVALRHQRDFIGVELNPEYAEMARARIENDGPLLNEVSYSTNNVQPTQERRSKCPSCGGVKIANPASKYFEARPNEDEDWDWDGCTQGSGT